MTANPKMEVLAGMQITIHGQSATIEQVADDTCTIRYGNGARRQLSVAAIGGLKLYDRLPNDTALSRPVEGGREVLYIVSEQVDFYTVDRSGADGEIHPRGGMSHADLVAWHMGGLAEDSTPQISSPYTPRPVNPRPPTPEALEFGQKRIDILLDEVERLQAELDRLQALLDREHEIRAEAAEAFMASTKQQQAEIARLEEKAAILAPVQQHHILRSTTPAELDDYSRKGWQVAHYQFSEAGSLNVVLTRQAPAPAAGDSPAARAAVAVEPVVEAAEPAAPVIEIIAPAPVMEPSLNEVKTVSGTILGTDKPVRSLTNNRAAHGDTKRIKPLTGAEIFAEALRDNLVAPEPRPFTQLGEKQNV